MTSGRVPRAVVPALVLAVVATPLVVGPAATTTRGALGLGRQPPPFGDLAQITATAGCGAPDAGRIGSAVCDPYGRPYNYPPVWHAVARAVGLGPGATVPLAVALVALALGALVLLVARADLRGRRLAVATAVVASPPLWLLVVRANTDLLLLALLVAVALLPRSRVRAPLLVGVATALKLYPLGALGGRADRGRLAVAAGAAAVGLATLAGSLAGLRAATPARAVSSFGAGVLPAVLRAGPDADVSTADQGVGAAAVAVVAGVLLAVPRVRAAGRALIGALEAAPLARSLVGTGAGVYAVTFLATTSYDYRLDALVLVVVGLLALPAGPGARGAGPLVVLGVVVCWACYPLRAAQVMGDAAATVLAAALGLVLLALLARALRCGDAPA